MTDIDEQQDNGPDGGVQPPTGEVGAVTSPFLAAKASAIRELTRHTRELARRAYENVIKIGRHLSEVRDDDQIAHGAWLAWIEAEFGWSDQTARRFIHVFKLSRDAKLNTVLNLGLPLACLYKIAAPGAKALREKIKEHIEAGEISQEMVIKAVTGCQKSPAKSGPTEPEPTESEPTEPGITEANNDDPASSAEARKNAYSASEVADGAGEHDGGVVEHPANGVADPSGETVNPNGAVEPVPLDGGDDEDHGAATAVGCEDTDPTITVERRRAPAKWTSKILQKAWEKATTAEQRQEFCDRVLGEFFEEVSGADIFAHVPAAKHAEVVAAFPVKVVVEVLGEQLRAALPTNPLLKLRELSNAAAAQTLYDAFGKDRFEAIVRKVHDLHSPKARKSGKSGKPFKKTLTLTANSAHSAATVSGNSAGKQDPRSSGGPVHRNGQ